MAHLPGIPLDVFLGVVSAMLSGGVEDWDALEQIDHELALATRVRDLEDKSSEILSAASEATRLLQECVCVCLCVCMCV